MTYGRVLIAMITYNSANVLPTLISSLADGLSGVDQWRLIVADNASTDDSVQLVRELVPDATVLELGGNFGYAAGINACMALADVDENVLILNADVQLGNGCVRALLSACADGTIGIAVPIVFHCDGAPEATMRRRPTVTRAFAEALLGAKAGRYGERLPAVSDDPSMRCNADWANGAVLFIPAMVRAEIGKWREDLFLYSEEVDYCRRVSEAGWTITQIPAAHAVHRGGDVVSSPTLWAQLITNKVVHVARWEGKRTAWLVWWALVLAQLLRLPLRRCIHRRALHELLAGRKTLLAGTPTNPAANQEFRRRIALSNSAGGSK